MKRLLLLSLFLLCAESAAAQTPTFARAQAPAIATPDVDGLASARESIRTRMAADDDTRGMWTGLAIGAVVGGLFGYTLGGISDTSTASTQYSVMVVGAGLFGMTGMMIGAAIGN